MKNPIPVRRRAVSIDEALPFRLSVIARARGQNLRLGLTRSLKDNRQPYLGPRESELPQQPLDSQTHTVVVWTPRTLVTALPRVQVFRYTYISLASRARVRTFFSCLFDSVVLSTATGTLVLFVFSNGVEGHAEEGERGGCLLPN